MNKYKVSFQHSENIYCSNIAIAETIQDVENHYNKYNWYNIDEATEYDIKEAERKGMPIITIDHKEEKEENQEGEKMANTYNYFEAVKEDVKNWIEDNIDLEYEIINGNYEDRDEIEEDLNEKLWIEDNVTGNASGSYTFNTYEAEENLCHNWDLIEEVANEYGYEPIIKAGYEYGAEWWDVTIRCYYLARAIAEVLDEIDDEITEAIEEREAATDAEGIA